MGKRLAIPLRRLKETDPAAYRAYMAGKQRGWREANPERSKANNARSSAAALARAANNGTEV